MSGAGNSRFQIEKPFPRDPVTGIILGAESFSFGIGSHAILFLHGWTSSPRELRFLAEKVAATGFHCFGPLLKGHGLTVSALSHTRYSDYLAQARHAFDELATKHERVSVCGLSMGGLLALQLALDREVATLVLIAPFLRPYGKTLGIPNDWLVGRVPIKGNLKKHLPGPIKDPRMVESHIAYHEMPAAAMVSVVKAARDVRKKVAGVTCPVLIHHDRNDTTSDFVGSEDLSRNLGSHDRTLLAYIRSNHILTLDFDRSQVESETLDWLARHRSLTGV